MPLYASTFITGFQDYVGELIPKALPDAAIHLLLDGLIVYQTTAPSSQIKRLRFCTNSFVVLKMFSDCSPQPLREMITATLTPPSQLKTLIAEHLEPHEEGQSFRIMASHENQFVSIAPNLRNTLERTISGIKRLRVNRSKPGLEFWFASRNEGYGFFLKRLTSHTAYDKILERGELKPELAYLLCALSEPAAEDIFLDPFCGSGAIPLERARAFPYNLIFATDADPDTVKRLRQKIKPLRLKNPLIVKQQNVPDLHAFDANFIHKIVTDPPWGLFAQIETEIVDFYRRMLTEMHRILRMQGILVILTARKEIFEQAAAFKSQFQVMHKYDILVSGKKAGVYKLMKIS